MAGKKTDLIQGTLDLLILKTVAQEPIHGYGIAQRILLTSKEILQVQQGSLYPALYRVEHAGLISSEWGVSDNNRRAKFYTLTKTGQARLRKATAEWNLLSVAMGNALAALPEEA